MLTKFVWWAQWFAIGLLPAWLYLGAAWFAGTGGWTSLFLGAFFCPILLIALTITALLSLLLRDIRNRTITVYLIASIVTWALVLLAPVFIQDAIDQTPFPPALAQRIGLSDALDQAVEWGIFWTCCGLFAITWAAIIVARILGSRRRAASAPRPN